MEVGDTVKLINVENKKKLEKLKNKKFFIIDSATRTIWIQKGKCFESCILLYKNRFVYAKMLLTERIKWK